MWRRSLKLTRKCTVILLESLMVVLLLAMLGAGIVMWRLSQGPVSAGFAKEFIESELSDPSHNIRLSVGEVSFAWAREDGRPEVTLKDVQLINTRDGRLVFSFESGEVSFSRAAILLGHIEPRGIIIRRPLITLVRDATGTVRLALDKSAEPAKQTINLFDLFDELSKPANEISGNWPLKSLRMIAVSDARLMVEDHLLGQSWLVPKIGLAIRHDRDRQLSAAASLWLEDADTIDPTVKANAAYDSTQRVITAGLGVNQMRSGFLATRFPDLDWLKDQVVSLNGQAQAQIDSTMTLTHLRAGLQSTDGRIMIPDVYEAPIPYKSLALNILYDQPRQTLTVQDSPIVFTDDFSLTLSGSAARQQDGSVVAPIRVKIANLPQARLTQYWPAVLKGDPSEEWALKRLTGGRIYDSGVDLVLKAAQVARTEGPTQKKWSVQMQDLKADFNIDDMKVDYRAPLAPVTKAKGKGHYDYKTDRLSVDVAGGMLGDLTLKSGKVVIDTVAGKSVGHASIDADLDGPLKAVLGYIAEEPISVKVPTVVEKVEGHAALKVNVSFPTLAVLPAEKIDVIAEGTMDDAVLPGLVHNLDVSGGPFSVVVKDRLVNVAGKAKLDGRDTNFTFKQYFESKDKDYSGQVVADLMADADLRQKFGVNLADWMDGTAPVRVVYTDFGGGRAQIDAAVDATPLTLMVKAMNYIKDPGVAAKATGRATLEKGVLTRIDDLAVETADAGISGAQMEFTQAGTETLLSKGRIPQARVKDTDVALDFTISPERLVSLDIKGKFMDAIPFLENNKKTTDYTGPALRATVAVETMRTSPTGSVKDARVSFAMDHEGMAQLLNFSANAGSGGVVFDYKPDAANQVMTLAIRADDAGAALQAFEVYQNVRGGKMQVSGQSTPGGDKKIVIGKASLSNFRVVNAPVLARLVNALSLPGILQLLGSDGISFTRLESDFVWTRKKGGDIIAVKDGRTAGASMGLTFEGTIDRIESVIAISGTIVPVSMVNDVIGSIPLIGDILSGGSKGGVFAATYTVRGPTKDPTTTVNPLSILAPGFLRRIFFE